MTLWELIDHHPWFATAWLFVAGGYFVIGAEWVAKALRRRL